MVICVPLFVEDRGRVDDEAIFGKVLGAFFRELLGVPDARFLKREVWWGESREKGGRRDE